jgi:hypothetical protein
MSAMSSERIAGSSLPARLRSVGPFCDDGQQAVSFELADGAVVRLRLDAESVRWLREELGVTYSRAVAGIQSPASSGSPSEPRSVPLGAEQQCPPAASSTAC